MKTTDPLYVSKTIAPLMQQYRSASPEADLILSIIIYEMDHDAENQQRIVELLNTEIDWKKFINMALDNGILPSVCSVLDEFNLCNVPGNIVEYFHDCFDKNMQRNEVLIEELVYLNNLWISI